MTAPDPPTAAPEPWEAIADALRGAAGDLIAPAQAQEIARALAEAGWRIGRHPSTASAGIDPQVLAEALHAQFRLHRPGSKPLSDPFVQAMASFVASQYDRITAERSVDQSDQ